MKFIHFADAHLDSPFRGLSFLPSNAFNEIHQAANKSLENIVDFALKEKVDLVLIAGDTFDSNSPSPKSQLFFAEQIKKLTDAQIQVVMIFGNHDHMSKEDLLVESNPYFDLLGNGEHVQRVSHVTESGFKYNVTGFSYLNNHIEKDKISEFPARDALYNFGLMHAGQKSGEKSQNVYAPFSLEKIKSLNYDYFALGHIHLRQILSENPWIVYPGNIQGRQIGELGIKGCYFGEINELTKKTNITFIPTSPILWDKVDLEIKGALSKQDLLIKIGDQINKKISQKTYISLNVLGAEFLTQEESQLLEDSDIWLAISKKLKFGSMLVDVRFKANEFINLNETDKLAFKQAEEETFDPIKLKQLVSDWAKKDSLAQRLLEDPEFIAELKNQTEVKLISYLKGFEE